MRLVPDSLSLRAQAIALRRAGKSRREIKEILGIGSNQTLGDALRGEPPPEWTRRPNAKDALRARARELRVRPGGPHRRRDRLLVRGHQEQTATSQ